jgi:hypothetical protein
MPEKPQEKISARDLVTELEACKTDHVEDFFKGKFEEERIQAVNKLRDIYLEDVKKGAATPDQMVFEARHWFGEGISIQGSKRSDWNYRLLYSDKFEHDMNGYKHSRAGDPAPPSRKEFDPAELRKLTSELESGNFSRLPTVFKGLYLEEQQRVIDAMIKLNQKDIAAKVTTARLWTESSDGNKSSNFGIRLLRAPDNGWFTNTTNSYIYSVDGRTGKAESTVRK